MTLDAVRLYQQADFKAQYRQLQEDILEAPIIKTGEWQSKDVSDKHEFDTPELRNVTVVVDIPATPEELMTQTSARLPWAEDHFLERVSGIPYNPAPSEAWWPFAQKANGDTNPDHKSEDGGRFSHTYPERMWPKFAMSGERAPNGRQIYVPHMGIRFLYGDLMDVVDQLTRSRYTRQAYLPIWFPEDTGAVHRKRVPCTLGYHFLIRGNDLQITYYMRSCDLMRHYQDDVYMAARLAQWMVWVLNLREDDSSLVADKLIMHIASLHCFAGDLPIIKYRLSQEK